MRKEKSTRITSEHDMKIPGKRGLASMDASSRRAIASMGGKAAHAKGTAHRFTTDEAKIAGQKGGKARGHRVNTSGQEQQLIEGNGPQGNNPL